MRWRRICLKSDLSPAGRRHGSDGGPERAEAVDKTRTMQEYDCSGCCCCLAFLNFKFQITIFRRPIRQTSLNKSTTAAHYLHATANPAHQSKSTRNNTCPPKRSHRTRTSL